MYDLQPIKLRQHQGHPIQIHTYGIAILPNLTHQLHGRVLIHHHVTLHHQQELQPIAVVIVHRAGAQVLQPITGVLVQAQEVVGGEVFQEVQVQDLQAQAQKVVVEETEDNAIFHLS